MHRQKSAYRGAARLIVFLTVLFVATGCGGGGGGGAGPTPATLLATLKAVLRGDLETAVVDPDAHAAVFIDLHSDGALSFACAAEAAWAADITMAHIHRGAAGSDGPVEVDLLASGATFDPGTFVADDTFAIDPVLAAEIAGAPEDFYVNVHTGAAPAGLVRQQLATLTPLELHTTLLGSEETAVVDPAARGAATLHIAADKQLDYRIGMHSPPVTDITAAHIHSGPAGVSGPIFVGLDIASATLDPTSGLLQGFGTPTLTELARICNLPGAFYINVHSAAAPAGVARGQLTDAPTHFWAPLTADDEVTPPSNPGARGGATVEFTSFSEGRVHMAVPPAEDINSITMAHIHSGAAGIDGPVEIDLMAGGDFVRSPASFSAEGSLSCTQGLFTRLLADPAGFYFNFHTAADPAGAVRGQLSEDPVNFIAVLDGTAETVVVDPAAGGNALVIVQDIFACSFSIDVTQPPAADLTAGHVHDGAPGTDGPVLIDLLGGSNVEVSGDSITGDTVFTGRTFARLLAVPERFYVNVHSAVAPAGIARGQLLRLTEDTPPAGLTYTSPVTYTEGLAIANNVPSSIGGAVSSYAVVPALPAGLSLDPVTGVISGTPTATAAAADYDVTATNASGSDLATVNVTIEAALPTNLQYATPVAYSVGTAIATNSPSNDGGTITSYSVAPALPAGLSLSTTTGDITGTPTAAAAAANYTVTGSNSAGSATFAVNITVNAVLQPPSSLSYTSPVSYGTGSAITSNAPTISGGTVATWSISPSLPAGLSFNTGSGVISGTPTTVTAAQNHTVTATNAAGSTTATVNVTVTLGAPAALSYSNDPNIGYVGTAIAAMNPSSSGGAVSSYSVTPALPAGLALNSTTGVISGTPTSITGQASYTVTASNATGNTTASVSIVVY